MKIKTILTGETGMLGEGILPECLSGLHADKVYLIAKCPCGYLKDIVEAAK